MSVIGIVAAGFLPGAGVAHASTAAGDDVVGIGVRLIPAEDDADDPRAQLYVVDHLPPGGGVRRSIEITNTTGADSPVSVYTAGATIDAGAFEGDSGATANELSSWTALSASTLVIPAGGATTITVSIDVPIDAAPGERYAVVWAEVRSASSVGIVQVNRVGIRLYVSVGPGAAPAADFAIESFTAERSPDGTPALRATVRNTGGRAIDLAGSVRLDDGPGGLKAGPFAVDGGSTLGLGDVGQVRIALDPAVPDGPWNAELTLHSGSVTRHAHASITFPGAGSSPAVPATTTDPGAELAARVAIAVAVVLVVVIAFIWALRRRPAPRRRHA